MQNRKYIIILFLLIFCGLQAQDTRNVRRRVTGEAEATVRSKKDISHRRNKKSRQNLIVEATFNAIEKGNKVKINRKKEFEFKDGKSEKSFDEQFDSFIDEILISYNLSWQKASDYEFTRLDGKSWRCEVSGDVFSRGKNRNLIHKPEVSNHDRRKYLVPDYTVIKKRLNTVNIKVNRTHLGSRKQVILNKKVGRSGKKKAYIHILGFKEDYAIGKIVKGYYNVDVGDKVNVGYFNEFRSGLRYEYSMMPSKKITLNNIDALGGSLNEKSEMVVNSHYLSYTTQNLRKRHHWDLGMEIMHVDLADQDTSVLRWIPKFNYGYYVNIIPEVLYISPTVGLGYMILSKTSTIFQRSKNAWNSNVVLDAGLSATLRVGKLDLNAGMKYRYINDFPQFNNFYPYIGLFYSLSSID